MQHIAIERDVIREEEESSGQNEPHEHVARPECRAGLFDGQRGGGDREHRGEDGGDRVPLSRPDAIAKHPCVAQRSDDVSGLGLRWLELR